MPDLDDLDRMLLDTANINLPGRIKLRIVYVPAFG